MNPRARTEAAAAERSAGKLAPAVRTAVVEIVVALRKAIDSQRLYGQGHSQVNAFCSALLNRLNAFLQGAAELRLEVRAAALAVDETEVLVVDPREDRLVHTLFADHVRAITLRRGVTQQELEALVRIWAVSAAAGDEDETFVTRCWDVEFRNINVETGRNVLDDAGDLNAEQRFWDEYDLGAMIDTLPATRRAVVPADAVAQLPRLVAEVADGARDTNARALHALAGAVGIAPAQEAPRLRRMLAALLERLVSERHVPQLDAALEQAAAALRLGPGREHAFDSVGRALAYEPVLRGVLLALADPAQEVAAARVLRYLHASAAPQLVVALCEALPDVLRVRLREVLCELLPPAAELVSRIAEAPAPAALELLHIARSLPWADGALVRARALKHPDAAVRRAAIEHLRREDAPLVEADFGALLADPAVDIRRAAVALVVRARSAAGLRHVMARVVRADVDADERRSLVVALGTVGGQQVAPVLRQLVRDEPQLPVRLAAVNALASTGDLLARPLLQEIGSRLMTPASLRKACEEAVKRLMQRAAGSES